MPLAKLAESKKSPLRTSDLYTFEQQLLSLWKSKVLRKPKAQTILFRRLGFILSR